MVNLIYENQLGVLNEFFFDVFGYFNDIEDWDIGEDIIVSQFVFCSLFNLIKYGQFDNYVNYRNFLNIDEGDYGGVYINSGILNKVVYNIIIKFGVFKLQ